MKRFLFHYIVLLLLLLRQQVVVAVDTNSENPVVSVVSNTRNLQQELPQTYNYRANYTADFQHLVDPSCGGEAPVLTVTCLKSQNMTITRTSSPTIVCTRYDVVGFQGDTSYECRNMCNGTACHDIYLSTEALQPMDGPYGSIQFLCEGDDYRQVDAAFNFSGGTDGSCINPQSRNLHVAKLGISCPTSSDDNDDQGLREYVYDDTYFECLFIGDPFVYGSSFDSVGDPDDVYTCLTGGVCSNEGDCTNLPFKDILIDSVVPSFLNTCVETIIPEGITSIPSQSPIIPVVGNSLYNVRFEALWGHLYDPNTDLETCRHSNDAVVISCSNNATAIRFHNSTDIYMNCTTQKNDLELHCIGDTSKIKNQFTSVIYDCYGGAISTSQVTYPEAIVSCDNNSMSVLLRSSVIMGIACDGGANLYPDAFFECLDSHHQFFVSETTGRYVCSESAIITNGSSVSDINSIPSVSIGTDSLWLRDPTETRPCINIVDSVPAPTPVTIPVIPPTSPPAPPVPMTVNSPAPIASNTQNPVSNSPVISPAPIASNLQNPVFNSPIGIISPISTPAPVAMPIPSTSIISNAPTLPVVNKRAGVSASVFAVIGGIAGVAISLIVFFVYRKGKKDGGNPYPHKDYANNAAGSNPDDPTQGNSDHLTRISGHTKKRPSTSASASTPSMDTSESEIEPGTMLLRSAARPTSMPATARRTTSASATSSNAYDIDYKDQARSVVHARPVKYSHRYVAGTPIQGMPMAMAVPITGTTAANEGTVIQSNQTTLGNAVRFDV